MVEWIDATWNPVTGCSPVSEGCENCYAKRHAERFRGRFGYSEDEPFRVTVHGDRLDQPLRWKKPRRILVCDMGDLFHEDVPEDTLDSVFDTMALACQHTFLVLTKRPQRMREYLSTITNRLGYGAFYLLKGKLLHNVWIGVTAENQRTADERIPILMSIPAAVRFVSVEPMLGPVNLRSIDMRCTRTSYGETWSKLDGLSGRKFFQDHKGPWVSAGPTSSTSRIDWVICGGESGPGARPMNPAWAREIRDQSVDAGVPFFFKQWGEWRVGESKDFGRYPEDISTGQYMVRVGKKRAGRLLDGLEWNEWPDV